MWVKMINSNIIIYKTNDGRIKIDCTINEDTIWLSLDSISSLFGRNKSTISRHIRNIFDEGELVETSTVAKYATVQIEGNRQIERLIEYFNLEVILAVGYRVKSPIATQFRQWATNILHDYLKKGFAINSEHLKNLGGGLYWKELLEQIRDIRASEKVLYRQVLDLYATSLDYNASMSETIEFFKIVQNKLHYAVSSKTASEIIFERANAEKPFMGLTAFKGNRPKKSEVTIAKNYMTEKELFALRRMVNAFFDMAELKAEMHQPMYMRDWLETLDKFTRDFGLGVLENSGSISHIDAVEKAYREYQEYKSKLSEELTEVEKAYLKSLNDMHKRLK
jgi:hypothetical protein